ncbi:MAG: hypothetical protein K0M40_11085 [Prolixibacteraceae bacterium]|nr:hypothetical protein [Prolixibacteraceae bacterium]
MNHFLKIIIVLLVTIAFFSCSDEFVNEKLDISGVAQSAIIISPEWDADDYQFKCEGVVNADFTINSKPDWLILDSNSGKFTDSIATIHGSANAEPRFSKIGFYVDQMLVIAGGKKYAVPLYYIAEGNPSVQVNRAFEISYNNYNQLQISNSGDGILLWDIVSMPPWLTVNMSQFDLMSVILGKGATANLPLTFDVQYAVQNNLKGTIVLKTNDKNNPLVEIAVSANLGTPDLSLYSNELNFGTSETSKIFGLYNYGNGILIWSFDGLPEWLSVSPSSGMYQPHSTSGDVIFTCDRSKLQTGLNTATIYLKTNALNKSSVPITVTVRVSGLNGNVRALDGNIVDAIFDKSTNTLFYVTAQPNKLVAYDVTAKTVLHEVALSKAPTCLSVREDFKQALIGHGGLISTVNLSSYTITKTYELDFTIYDIEWAEDDWYCYSKANSSNSNLLWINTNTDETYETISNSYTLGSADLKKVPNQSYIIASRTTVSPTGIFVFDIKSKTRKSYAHESIGNVWFFNGDELMITGYSSIIRTSAVTSASGDQINGPSSIGELKISEYPNVSWWIDYCEANHSIWAIFSYYTHSYYPPVAATIYQFEDNDYKLVKTYKYDNLYQPDIQTAAYEVEARYVFSNSSGTELSVLRKGKDNNIWSVEFIPVQ